MRKFILTLVLMLITTINALAITIEEGQEAFNTFLKLSNNYKNEVTSFYDENTVIKRILLLKDGSQKEITLNKKDYKQKVKFYRRIAMIIRYKLKFTEVNFAQEGENIRVYGFRKPFAKKEQLPFEMLFGADSNGIIRIKEELFYTRSIRHFKKYLKD